MKRLDGLLENIDVIAMTADRLQSVGGVAADSKRVRPNDLFVAIRGGAADGNDYIGEAAAKGAAAVVSDDAKKAAGSGLPYVAVSDAREAYAYISSNFFDNPSRAMRFIGVSGTNGKTTTAHMIRHILSRNGIKTGLVGTLGNIVDERTEETDMTTPDPYEFFALLRRMADCGCGAVVSEVSAHAIYLKKIEPVTADVAVFTNCSQDHLDFFETMERYSAVKKSYFKRDRARTVVVNADDGLGVDIINTSDAKVVSYGVKNPSDVFAVNIGLAVGRSAFYANVFDEIIDISLPLSGLFNVYNALAAITAARLSGISLPDIRESLTTLPEIPGRFNIIKGGGRDFILDYAHSPDGLKKVLTAARKITKGGLISVFGCGGDRDRTKRPLMGEISAVYADFTILTSDNPRFERPVDIIRDIEKGLKGITTEYLTIIDREEAIKKAYESAKKGDVIVVAGKGAENYMDAMGVKTPYGDRETILKIIGGTKNGDI
ncbi:MAG: UDP-N-acetylmuramoyl-L-alanyl-D-glutamate--2,6-diaminopimelate ligase [Clostridiales bacterium]|jgi:UDP-N-acetylmuramoyl-L-alanyl-D-glutamate--2,6-diaminopimelate ligase|nr:UDP-N-acetylmuramoyl-L-alanyl-D-glutamate--2,6-diaminopimelate ligase [Clostridiales bacterium]